MPDVGTMDHHGTVGALIRRAQLYDLLVTVLTFGREKRFREAILSLAGLSAGERVLDVGCGTGTLAMGIKRKVGSEGAVNGIDASTEMVALAREKTRAAGLEVDSQVAPAQELPFGDSSFDAVLCTMVMHHLPRDQRANAIAEMFRVLKPNGRLLIVDLSREGGVLARLNLIALLHGQRSLDTTRQAEDLIRRRGFGDVNVGALGVRNLGYVFGRKTAAS